MKKHALLLLSLCFLLAACHSGPSFTTFEAKILEIHEGFFLVEPLDGYPALESYDCIEVPMQQMEPSLEPAVGDILSVAYDGQIQECYPPRIAQVHSIRVVEPPSP